MRVLNLVPSVDSRFFEQQVTALEKRGVTETTLTVPGSRDYTNGEASPRSVFDYIKFVGPVLRHSFGDYDLIHANFGLTAPPAVVQPRLPTVLSLWGTDLMGEYGWLSRACARRVDEVVVMTPEMQDYLDRDSTVIPHGIDLEKFAPRDTTAAKVDLGWAEDRYHVLFPYPRGREVKNYPLAASVSEAAEDRLDAPIELHTITDVPHDEMSTYLNASDALLLTSRREGSPNSVKEALACNTPVVSTDVGDVADRLADISPSAVGRTENELVDGLVEVLLSNGRSNGRDAVREISVERTSDRLYEVYRNVLEDS